jgi:hypothetical protein
LNSCCFFTRFELEEEYSPDDLQLSSFFFPPAILCFFLQLHLQTMRAFLVAASLLAVIAVAQKPIDLPCVTWEPLSYSQNTDPTDLFVAAYTWVIGYGTDDCVEMGDVYPCFASDPGTLTWGHHDYQPNDIPNDYCRIWLDDQVQFSNNMYVPKKGPQWQTWKWQLVQTGGTIPDNAIRYGGRIMARNTVTPPGYCFGKGFTGWAVDAGDNKFGVVHFSIVSDPVTMTDFEVAICKAYHPTTPVPTPAPTPVPTPQPSTATPSPPETPSPTLPPNNKPYIRFGNTIPSANFVDAVITQGNITYTWTNYGFSKFSGWVEVFEDGYGQIQIYQNNGGSRGSLLLTTEIPLTPGPLVVVVKDMWPPKVASNVETIAASYVPPAKPNSGVRLFNLSPDTAQAGLQANGKTLVNNVKYTLGSIWANIPEDTEATFSVFDSSSNKVLATSTFTPPTSPFVFTNFLVGLQSGGTYGTRIVALIDAPEH